MAEDKTTEELTIQNNLTRTPMRAPTKDDPVNPSHYRTGGIMAITVIRAWNLGFCLGNCIKYIQRHRHKNGIEDLKKAQWYLQEAINELEGECDDSGK